MNEDAVFYKMPVYISGGDPSPDTIKAYRRSASVLLNWAISHSLSIDSFSVENARDFIADCFRAGSKRDTVNQRIAGSRAFFRTAIAIGEFTGENPFEALRGKLSNPDDVHTNYYSTDQVQAIYDACETNRDRAIISLMAVEGLRTIEIVRLKVQDCNFQDAKILIHGKGKHDAYIYPTEKTLELLADIIGLETSGNVFRNLIDDRPLTRDGVRFIVNSILRKAGLKKKGFSCHTLRHSCGTNLYQSTKDIRLVQDVLRHQSPAVTSRYSHVVNRKNATAPIAIK